MRDIQSIIQSEVPIFFNELSRITSGRFRAGLVGFGDRELDGYPIIRHTLTSNAASFESAVENLKIDGKEFEYGLLAMAEAGANNVNGQELSPIAFPGTLGFCAVLFSDEDSDVPFGSTAEAERVAAQDALNPGALISVVRSSWLNSQQDYVNWADATYDIASFNSTTAPSILDGIVEKCFQTIIVEQSPTQYHTSAPTQAPSRTPTLDPTTSPTMPPMKSPTLTPSTSPTSAAPTEQQHPTHSPTGPTTSM